MSDPEADMSPWSSGGRIPGPVEIQLPSAVRRREVVRHLNARQETEITASETKDADAGGDAQNHQLLGIWDVHRLHPSKSSLAHVKILMFTSLFVFGC